jgi:hypothetical protein
MEVAEAMFPWVVAEAEDKNFLCWVAEADFLGFEEEEDKDFLGFEEEDKDFLGFEEEDNDFHWVVAEADFLGFEEEVDDFLGFEEVDDFLGFEEVDDFLGFDCNHPTCSIQKHRVKKMK